MVCVLQLSSHIRQKYLCCKVNRGRLITLAPKAVYVMPSAAVARQSAALRLGLWLRKGRANTK